MWSSLSRTEMQFNKQCNHIMLSACASGSSGASSTTSGSSDRCMWCSPRVSGPIPPPMLLLWGCGASGVTAVIISDNIGRSGSGLRRHVYLLSLPLGLPVANEWPLNCLNTMLICLPSLSANRWDDLGGSRSFRTLPASLLARFRAAKVCKHLCKPSLLSSRSLSGTVAFVS